MSSILRHALLGSILLGLNACHPQAQDGRLPTGLRGDAAWPATPQRSSVTQKNRVGVRSVPPQKAPSASGQANYQQHVVGMLTAIKLTFRSNGAGPLASAR